MSTPETQYGLCAQITGSKGAINALTFSKDGKLLLSGGDDGCVRVWNTGNFAVEQVLTNSRWGQVTALTWIYVELPADHEVTTAICVGSGRGTLGVCPMSNGSTWFLSNKAAFYDDIFNFNDAIEAQAYDSLNLRLAVASHSGRIRLYTADKAATLTLVWEASIDKAIPRSLAFFGGANQSLLIHGLETGEMCCRDAQNSNVLWTKTLAGAIGYAALSPDETALLVDNLTSGRFDLYNFPSSAPASSVALAPTRRFIKQCIFTEEGKIAICGSDASRVEVVDVVSGESLQTLQANTATDRGMIQTVAASMVDRGRYLIAGGSNSTAATIYVWEKKMPAAVKPQQNIANTTGVLPKSLSHYTKQTLINMLFAALIVLGTFPNWSPLFWKSIGSTSASFANGAQIIASFSGATEPAVIPAVAVFNADGGQRKTAADPTISVQMVPPSVVTVTVTKAIHSPISTLSSNEETRAAVSQTGIIATVTVTADQLPAKPTVSELPAVSPQDVGIL